MVARDLLARSNEEISFGQIHRLLYLIEGYSLGIQGVTLIDDTVLAGESGPEWPALLDDRGREEVLEKDSDPTYTEAEAKILDMVFAKYGRLPLSRLNEITSRQWPVRERPFGEVILTAEMRIHFQDLLAAQRVQSGERMPELIAFRYRSGTAYAMSGDGHGHVRGVKNDDRVIELPEVHLGQEDPHGADYAVSRIEKYVLMALRLWEKGSEDFYPVARQTIKQIDTLRAEAERVEDDYDRRDSLRRLGHCRSTLEFLRYYSPGIEGSGPVRPAQIKGKKIGSITSSGLPSLGKRGKR
ncbi:hypothetical protein [Nesterenkonia sandarakina]|uniref:Putative phage-associated protein n=1 Tax=Nesterenkonia sandarakina TaxID=272918 RepID=A0A7Z0E7D6_9MICC|nr:hypothetical protein [Nesterenkonia sandarakina]NYJ15985.1 putative phage-associated protein [Nesterenkonia sandarakina]